MARTCCARQPVGHHAQVVKGDRVPGERHAASPRRTPGRPSPWLLLTLAVVFGGLAVASWIIGQSVLLSVA
jgi:hypothetical protein